MRCQTDRRSGAHALGGVRARHAPDVLHRLAARQRDCQGARRAAIVTDGRDAQRVRQGQAGHAGRELHEPEVVAIERRVLVRGQAEQGERGAAERRRERRWRDRTGNVVAQPRATFDERFGAELAQRLLDRGVADATGEGNARRAAPGERPDHPHVSRHHLAQSPEQLAGNGTCRPRRAEPRHQRLEQAHLLEAAARSSLHRRRAPRHEPLARHRDPVLAEPLRLVQRRVGRLHQGAQIGAVLGRACNTEAQRQPPATEIERLQRALQAPADGAGVRPAGGRQEQRELLAADAEDGVAGAHATAQHVRNRTQRVIACDVAVPVVELLEVVEIGEDEGELDLGSRLDQRERRLVEAAMVPEPGQGVRHCGALRSARACGGSRARSMPARPAARPARTHRRRLRRGRRSSPR